MSQAPCEGVLLVDDNAIQAAARQTILKRAGYRVVAALDPVEALQRLREDSYPLDIGVVITDHLMPVMTGAEFIRELRKTHPHFSVIVISGLEEAQSEYEGLDVSFLTKPVSPDVLLTHLRRIAGERQAGAA